MSRAAKGALLLVILAGVAAGVALSRRDAPADEAVGGARPNILFITVDSLRADHLGLFGYPRDTSPVIDAMARESVLFTRAVSQATWTYGSVPSFVTSRYPQSHRRVRVPQAGGRAAGGVSGPIVLLGDGDVTFLELLRDAGFRTALVTDHAGLGQIVGFKKNFDDTDWCWDQRSAEWVASHARQRLRALAGQRPFALWVYFNQLHYPYVTSSALGGRFQGDGKLATHKSLPFSEDWFGVREAIPLIARIGDHQEVDYYVAAYDGCLAATDDAIGGVLAELEALGLAETTLVVLNADHGELLGEEGYYFTHGAILDSANTHVPLLFRLPGRAHAGTRVVGTVGLIDLAPTLLALAGVDATPMAPVGRSLVDCFAAPSRCDGGIAFAAAHRAGQDGAIDDQWMWRCVRGGDCGLFAYPGGTDPVDDQKHSQPAAGAALDRALARWRADHPGTLEDHSSALDPETLAGLRALGYVP